MARQIPQDSSIDAWLENRHVDVTREYSLIKDGLLNLGLLAPLAGDRQFCHALHGHFADWKYARLFASDGFLADLESSLPEISDGIVFTAPANHWHYCVDGLANLSVALFERFRTVYVDASMSDDQAAFLTMCVERLSGKTPDIVRLTEATYALRNVCVPTNKPFPEKIANLESILAPLAAGIENGSGQERIYVSRRNAATRQLVNEDELLSMLVSEFGFLAVENESLSLLDQMRAYKDATVVMGPHGAGLTNIVFADAPDILIELFNSFQQPFYPALAQASNASYMGIEGEVAPHARQSADSDNAPFSMDIAKVRRGLTQVLGR